MMQWALMTSGSAMGKKRISDRAVRALAYGRMERLVLMAAQEARQGNLVRSRRYNDLARRIAMRCNVSMRYGASVCPHCLVTLLPGRTCRVRLNRSRLTLSCLSCGNVRRLPYLREKKEEEECRGQGKT